MEGGILFSTNDLVIIFTPPRFFLCPTVDCARLRAPTVTHFRLAVTDSARVNNPVCLSLPACTGVSVGYGPSRRGAGLKDVCVCGCESLCLIPHKGYTSNKWVCFLILPTTAYLSSLCMSSGLSVMSLSTFPGGERMLVFLFLWTVYSCSLPLFLLSPDTSFRTPGVLSKLGSLDCCKWVANIFCRLFGYFTLLMMNLLVVMNLFSFTIQKCFTCI